jgi:hypothetical protein
MNLYSAEPRAFEHRCQWCGVVTDLLFCDECSDDPDGEAAAGNLEL